LRAALLTASAAAATQSAGPSTSIISSAPVSGGTPRSEKLRTMSMAAASMNSSAQGVIGWAMMAATASAAAWMLR
jgi:hypothetical protein